VKSIRRVLKLAADDERFDDLWIPGDADIRRSISEHKFEGLPIAVTWQPMTIEPLRDEHNPAGEKPVGDCTLVGSDVPVFSPKAVELLIDLLEPNGELLPMDFLGETWFGYNITTVLRALDRTKSQVEYFPGTDRAMFIDRWAFVPGAITSPIFKVPEKLTVALVTDEFVNAVNAARLKGLAFPELWREL
jgi:hypothetical protein